MVPVSLRPMQWWLDLMARGGVAMWPLAVISVGAVALLLERAWAYRRGAEVFLRRVEDATPRLRAERAQADIERFLPTLSTVITAAPLIGILGTVLGLIDSFAVIGAGGGVRGMQRLSLIEAAGSLFLSSSLFACLLDFCDQKGDDEFALVA